MNRALILIASLAVFLVCCSSNYQLNITLTRGGTFKTRNVSIDNTSVRVYGKEIPVPETAEEITVRVNVKEGKGTVQVIFQPDEQRISLSVKDNRVMEFPPTPNPMEKGK